jgi:hypothetical protein
MAETLFDLRNLYYAAPVCGVGYFSEELPLLKLDL